MDSARSILERIRKNDHLRCGETEGRGVKITIQPTKEAYAREQMPPLRATALREVMSRHDRAKKANISSGGNT